MAGSGITHITLLLYVVAHGVLPTQTQLALHHQAVLLAEPAVAVNDLLAFHVHYLDPLAIYTTRQLISLIFQVNAKL